MMENFATYEKEMVAKILITKHTVRIPLNSTKASLISTLSNVPGNATVSMVVDDVDNLGYGKIVFEEKSAI